jgi:hypothetical protein
VIGLLLAAAVGAPAPAPASLAFRCPAPVPIVGDVRRTQVDKLYFGVMARAEAAGRMPVQADVDAVVAADSALQDAELQPSGYTPTNVLLYRVSPFRAAFYTTETWGYAIDQAAFDATPVITDSEATFRRTGGDLTAIRAAMDVVHGWRVGHPGGFPSTARLVRDMLHRGVNESRVAAGRAPRTGWIAVWTSADHQQAFVRGRTCAKQLTEEDDATAPLAVPPPAVPSVCPADGRVPVVWRRQARRVFDEATAHALLAGHATPDASDATAGFAAAGSPAGVTYRVASDRFVVERRSAGGGLYRIEWLGIDLPVIVTNRNDLRRDVQDDFQWQLDRVAASLHRHHGHFRPARALAHRHVPGVSIRIFALRSAHATGRGRAGIWVTTDRRVAFVRGRLCGATFVSYAAT